MSELDIINAMKAEAKALNGEFFAWRECSATLINCKFKGDRYEWRRVDTAAGPGRSISEHTALEILQSHSGWKGGE